MTAPASYAERYEAATPDQRRAAVAALNHDQQVQLAMLAALRPWWWYGRPDQFEPQGDWRWWVINGGRGWGKTRTGAETTVARARKYPGLRSALIAATFTDGRDTMVEGESGLLSCVSAAELRGGSLDEGWNRSMGELFFANGSVAKVFTSEKPRRLRGPQHHWVWGDEPSYWNDVHMGTDRDSTFSNANIGLRLPPQPGWDWESYRPAGVLTMTPRMVPLLKVPEDVLRDKPHAAGLLQRPDVHLTIGPTMANLRNLDRSYYDAVIAPMLNSALGQQELGGILLEDVEGALWTQAQLQLLRTDTMPPVGELAKTAVALDPAGGGGYSHDEHGIVVASSSGTRDDMRLWVRADLSLNGAVDTAARRCIMAAHEYAADAIVYEKNQGQDWVGGLIESVYQVMKLARELPEDWRLPTLTPVTAITSKLQRATPVSVLYRGNPAQVRVRHVGSFPVLEGQMTSWVPGETGSPDRLDALVWVLTWLYGMGPARAQVASPAARERGRRQPGQPSTRMPAVYGTRGARR